MESTAVIPLSACGSAWAWGRDFPLDIRVTAFWVLRGQCCGASAGETMLPLLGIQVRHVSLRLCTQAKSVDELTRGVAHVMELHGVKAAHFVAHSFGTFVVAHMTHLYPDLVKSTLLCDPVRHCTLCGIS